MSIFSKSLDKIGFSDIQELLDEPSQENIRLEFKREPPAKDEKFSVLKKITSFANAFGGYIVFGVEEKGGIVVGIPGMDPKPRYDQTLNNWCWQDVYPPLTPSVSKPIDHPDNAGKVFYVIYVPHSTEAPHFINGRKGCYVRTDEISRFFEPQLAKYEEIAFLANRRKRAEEQRESAIQRAKRRFAEHQIHDNTPAADVEFIALLFAITPTFPSSVKFRVEQLREFLLQEGRQSEREGNDGTLPVSGFKSHHEGFYISRPGGYKFSYFEIDVHGLLFCGYRETDEWAVSTSGNELDALLVVDRALRYLLWANRFYQHLGYDGLLTVRVALSGLGNKEIEIHVPHGIYTHRGSTRNTSRLEYETGLDDSLEFSIETSSTELEREMQSIAKEIYEIVCFACGCGDIHQYGETTQNIIEGKYKRLRQSDQ